MDSTGGAGMKHDKQYPFSKDEMKYGITTYTWKSVKQEAESIMYNQHDKDFNKLPLTIDDEAFCAKKAYLEALIQKDIV
jgi:hypothetical protein